MLSFPQWGDKVFDAAPSAQSCATGECNSTVTPKVEKKVTTTSTACKSKSDYEKKEELE